jgi:hypothetical protein
MFHSYLSSVAGTVGQLVVDVPSGLSLTPPQEIKKGKLYLRLPAVLTEISADIRAPFT